jgi:hypothetical protein
VPTGPSTPEHYTEAGFLAIDSNVAEREMKWIASGRIIWLTVGSPRGSRTAAVLFRFMSMCQRLGVEPGAYLQDVLTRLLTTPTGQRGERLPEHWQRAKPRQQRQRRPRPRARLLLPSRLSDLGSLIRGLRPCPRLAATCSGSHMVTPPRPTLRHCPRRTGWWLLVKASRLGGGGGPNSDTFSVL